MFYRAVICFHNIVFWGWTHSIETVCLTPVQLLRSWMADDSLRLTGRWYMHTLFILLAYCNFPFTLAALIYAILFCCHSDCEAQMLINKRDSILFFFFIFTLLMRIKVDFVWTMTSFHSIWLSHSFSMTMPKFLRSSALWIEYSIVTEFDYTYNRVYRVCSSKNATYKNLVCWVFVPVCVCVSKMVNNKLAQRYAYVFTICSIAHVSYLQHWC